MSENSSTNASSRDQSVQYSDDNLKRYHNENALNHHTNEEQHCSISFSNEQGKKIKQTNNHPCVDTFAEAHQQVNKNKIKFLHSSNQQHRSSNHYDDKTFPTRDTIIGKPNASLLKPLGNKKKLNTTVESATPTPSPRLNHNNEQLHSFIKTTPHWNLSVNEQIRSKAATPLGHYPNQEQTRDHVNRSVIKRQHPSYLPIAEKRNVKQQMAPFNYSSTKPHDPLFRQQNQPAHGFCSGKSFWFLVKLSFHFIDNVKIIRPKTFVTTSSFKSFSQQSKVKVATVS